MAGLTRKGKVYYALFHINGKTKWKRIGKVSYQDAREYIKKLDSKSDREKLGLIDIKPVPFNDLITRYLNYSKTNKSFRTWERDVTSSRVLGAYFAFMWIDSIDDEHIDLYKAKRQGKGISNRTINIELLCLQSMLRKAVEWRNLAKLPKIKKLAVQKKPPRFLSQAELEIFINAASLWLRLILIVLRSAGLRSKQLRELQLDYADYDNDLLTVLNTKGNGFYSVSMDDELKAALLYLRDNYVSPHDRITPRQDHQKIYFFCNPDGSPIGSFKTTFYKTAEKAGLMNVTPHTLRHTFASHLVMSGVDLPTVKELMGHKSIVTTMIYAHLSDEHKARAIKTLPWGEKKLMLVKE
jgi:integrase